MAHEAAARVTNPDAKVIGFSVNTAAMEKSAAEAYLKQLSDRFGMPAVDPVRMGVGPIVDLLG